MPCVGFHTLGPPLSADSSSRHLYWPSGPLGSVDPFSFAPVRSVHARAMFPGVDIVPMRAERPDRPHRGHKRARVSRLPCGVVLGVRPGRLLALEIFGEVILERGVRIYATSPLSLPFFWPPNCIARKCSGPSQSRSATQGWLN